LSESEAKTETVVIPGQLRLSNPVPPPVIVPLPIVAWPHVAKNVWLGLLMLFGSLITLPLAAVLAFVAPVALGAIETWTTLRGGFAFLIILASFPIFLFWGVGCLGAALTCFWDAIRSGPALEITADGLRDYRSGLSVPWSSVRSVRLLGFGVDLQLRAPVTNWQNPFRVGILCQRYRPVPDRIIVSAGYLDVPGHVVTYAILTLVQWHGGEVIAKAPGYGGEIQRLIPRASVKPVV
jgi:hypothetical protein